MANATPGRGLCIFAVGLASAIGGCSASGVKPADKGTNGRPDAGAVLGVDADTQTPVACRVALDDALNPCGATSVEQEMRYQGTDFANANGCFDGVIYQTFHPDYRWDCSYGIDGTLVAWDRIESTQLCGGRASAVVADVYSMGQLMSCLSVDTGWTWILGFDPGPATIPTELEALTTGPSAALSFALGFTLGGAEVAGADLTFRYWYTADAVGGSAPPPTVSCDGFNGIGCDLATLSIVPVTPSRPTADTYAEVGFPNVGIISTGFDYELTFSITRNDGALYDQSNDHSYNGATQPTPTTKVTAYVKGVLIYGTEP
jgi:hypothetical protein